LGSAYLNLTPRGIIYTLVITAFTQCIEMFNAYVSQKRLMQRVSEAAVKGEKLPIRVPPDINPKDLSALMAGMRVHFKGMAPKLYARNFAICACLTLVASLLGAKYLSF
jgi:hypothetical protein